MNPALFTGVSGLNANMSKLSVIGNNIANVNTVGFKASRVSFGDILSQSVGSTGEIGLGVQTTAIKKVFTQGAFESTGSSLDVAISGNGFFVVKDPALGAKFYSRAGEFQMDKEGYVVDPEGMRVQGYMANSSGVVQNTITDIQMASKTKMPQSTSNVNLKANLDLNAGITGFIFKTGVNDVIDFTYNGTNYTASLVNDGGLTSNMAYTGVSVASAIKTAIQAKTGTSENFDVSYNDQKGLFSVKNMTGNAGNLTLNWLASTSASLLGFTANSGAMAPGAASDVSDVAAGAFDVTKAGDTSNFSTPITVYDSLGNERTVTMYFRKDSFENPPAPANTGNVWNWYAVVDAADSASGVTEIQGAGVLRFNTSGALYSESVTTVPSFNFSGGATSNQSIAFNFGSSKLEGSTGTDGTTQFGTGFGVAALTQDGYAAGTLLNIGFEKDGTLRGVYSNGQSLVIAQLVLADFANPTALSSAGKNLYMETFDTGQPLIGKPGSSGRGLIQAGTLERSNVDLAREFVDMISAQRGFQANSKIITTTDDILAELVNLKR